MDHRQNHGDKAASGDHARTNVVGRSFLVERMRSAGFYVVTCYRQLRDAAGNLVFRSEKRRMEPRGWRKVAALVLGVASLFASGAPASETGFLWRETVVQVPVHDYSSPKWIERVPNKIPTVGLNYGQNTKFKGTTQSTSWYIGLKGTGTVVAGDTMASHGGWAEIVPYSDSTRQAWTPGTVASGAVDNTGSVASFNINATSTIYGAFVVDVSTKSGTTGTLYSAADFAASRGVASGDLVQVTITFTDTSST